VEDGIRGFEVAVVTGLFAFGESSSDISRSVHRTGGKCSSCRSSSPWWPDFPRSSAGRGRSHSRGVALLAVACVHTVWLPSEGSRMDGRAERYVLRIARVDEAEI